MWVRFPPGVPQGCSVMVNTPDFESGNSEFESPHPCQIYRELCMSITNNLVPNEIPTSTAIRLLVEEAYPRILNDPNYIPTVKITDTQFRVDHLELNKDPETNYIHGFNTAPLISSTVAKSLKMIHSNIYTTLQLGLSRRVIDLYIQNFDLQPSIVDEFREQLRYNRTFQRKLAFITKVIIAKIFKTGFSFQEFVAIYTDTYMKWIGKEESKYLYSHFYDKVTLDMFNLYKQNPAKFQQYMEDLETKNYLISGLKLGYAKTEQSVDSLVTKTMNYYKDIVPNFSHNIFIKISPQTVKIASQPYGLSTSFNDIISILCKENMPPPPHTVFKFIEKRGPHQNHLPLKLEIASNIKQHKKDMKFKGSLVDLYRQLLRDPISMDKLGYPYLDGLNDEYTTNYDYPRFMRIEDENYGPVPF